MRPLAALLLPALLALLPVVAQDAETADDGPTFSLDVKVVNVLATVKDRGGRLLSTLTKDDFILSEDGVRQEIRYFSHQTDLPLTIGLLIDTSGSQRALIADERSAGLMFFRSILRKDKDLAFLMSFDRNVELLQDYTASLGLLERGLDDEQPEDRKGRRGEGGGRPAPPQRLLPCWGGVVMLGRQPGPGQDHRRGNLLGAAGDRPGPLPARGRRRRALQRGGGRRPRPAHG